MLLAAADLGSFVFRCLFNILGWLIGFRKRED